MSSGIDQLWMIVKQPGPVDARVLFDVYTLACRSSPEAMDFRTRVLMRDVGNVLSSHFGKPLELKIEDSISDEVDRSDRGFASLEGRLVKATDPQSLFQMLRELGSRIHSQSTIIVGGSMALMIDQLITRATEDADLVDEIPEPIRVEHDLLAELASQYGLKLTHFQSHYLPDGWHGRIRSLGTFGSISAFRVDPLDVLIGKLFSNRRKDLDDLRAALPRLKIEDLTERLRSSSTRFRKDEHLAALGKHNWYILTGIPALP